MARTRRTYLRWLLIILLAIGLYGLLPQVGSFHDSLNALGRARTHDIWLAAAAVAGTYLAAAGTYVFLATKPLRYWRTVLVQLASMFVNRLFPAGIGGIGANYRYLRQAKHSTAQAGTIVAVNNLLGIVGHNLLFWVLLVLFHDRLPALHRPHFTHQVLLIIVSSVLIVGGVLLISQSRKARSSMRHVKLQLRGYVRRPLKLGLALGSSLLMTLSNVGILYFSALALGLQPAFITVLLVFSLGIVLGTATPTPGGLGGIEAGLVAGFVAFHYSAEVSLATVLLYRLVCFWAPLLGGAGALAICRQRKYL